jgi:hypothetical protein
LYYAGPVSCSVTQHFAEIILDIPRALLLPSKEEGADSKTQKSLDTMVGVEFSDDAIILKNSSGDVAIEVRKKSTSVVGHISASSLISEYIYFY